MLKRVVAYCRVSTKSDDQENSFKNQKSYFEREINNNEAYEFVDIYADRGITGTSLTKRPDFNRMLTDAGLDIGDCYNIIAKPKFDLIMTKNTSRFARNVSVDAVLKALARNGVYVYFLDLNMTTENTNDITLIQIISTMDERESRDKSKKTSFGMVEGAKKGMILCHRNIYGYKYLPRPYNRLEIIPEEAEVIRRIFQLYLDGYGAYRICKILGQEGICNRKGKIIPEASIRTMLENEKYCGLAARMKYDTGEVFAKHSAKVRPKEEQIIFETDKIPAIVDIETFNKAQEIRESRVQSQIQKGINHGTTDYAGKILCGCCGSQYRATQTKVYGERKTRYYACVRKRRIAYDDVGERIMLCNNPNINEDDLNGAVTNIQYLSGLRSRVSGGISELNDIIEVLYRRIDNQSEAEIENLKKQSGVVLERKERLLDLYSSNSFSKEMLDKKVKPLNESELALIKEIKELSKTNEEIHRDIEEVKQTLTYLQKQEAELQTPRIFSRKEILDDIESIEITPYQEILVNYRHYEDIGRLVAKHGYMVLKSRIS